MDNKLLAGQRFSSIFSADIICFINLIWSSVSIIVKFEFSPTAAACFLKSFAQIEWKVPSHDNPIASVFRIKLTLFCISLAALFVNVTERIWFGKAFFDLIICAILEVKTLVLPEPAPATISKGPFK